MLRLIDYFPGVIVIPVVVEYSILLDQIGIGFGMWKRSQYGEFSQVEVNLEQEIN